MVSACVLLGWVSLLKSQSRFLIWKRIYFVPLLKSKNRLLIQKIHNGGGFWKEWILPVVTQNNFNTYTSVLLFDHTAHLYGHLWTRFMDCTINFFPFYHGGKIIIQNWRTYIFLFSRTNATQLHQCILQDITFPVHILLQDSSSFGQSKAVSLS